MKKIIKVLILLSLLSVIAGIQYLLDPPGIKYPKVAKAAAFKPQVIKALNLGLDSASAALLWIELIQKLGSYLTSLPPQYFAESIERINSLDPKFSYPYAFGVLVLPFIDKDYTQRAIAIARPGIKQAEPDWRIPYYIGTTYHVYLGDRKNALKYFAIARNTPGAPEEFLTRFIAIYGSAPDKRSQTKTIWKTIYATTKDESTKEMAFKYLAHFEILDLLDEAIAIYKEKHGEYPKSIDELVADNILKAIPQNPFGMVYYIKEDGRVGIKSPADD